MNVIRTKSVTPSKVARHSRRDYCTGSCRNSSARADFHLLSSQLLGHLLRRCQVLLPEKRPRCAPFSRCFAFHSTKHDHCIASARNSAPPWTRADASRRPSDGFRSRRWSFAHMPFRTHAVLLLTCAIASRRHSAQMFANNARMRAPHATRPISPSRRTRTSRR
jgi:hypothetical protein